MKIKLPSKSEVEIYIPSCGRAGQVKTLAGMSRAALKVTYLVVPLKQAPQYLKCYPGIKVVAEPQGGISAVRQWILEKRCRTRYCIMLDDDLTFYRRIKPNDWHLENLPAENFDDITRCLLQKAKAEKLAHLSISMREGANRHTESWCYNQRYTRYFMFDREQLHGIKFGRTEVMEDFDVALQLIRKGKPSAICYLFAQNQGGSNTAGGCSTYRSLEVQKKAAHTLARLHAPFVKVVTKKTKTAWNGQERTDVLIHWKRAYENKA